MHAWLLLRVCMSLVGPGLLRPGLDLRERPSEASAAASSPRGEGSVHPVQVSEGGWQSPHLGWNETPTPGNDNWQRQEPWMPMSC